MTISRKHYESIATAIDQTRADIVRNYRHDYAERAAVLQGTAKAAAATAAAMAADNERFDRRRFLLAALEGPAYIAAQNAGALNRDTVRERAREATEAYVALAREGRAAPMVWEDTYSPGDWYWTDHRGQRSQVAYVSEDYAKLALAEHITETWGEDSTNV